VFIWSLATAAVPRVASFIPGLLFCRLLVGLGEGVSPAAATDLIARVMPVTERSRAVGTVFGGLYVGSVVGLLLAPVIIKHIGWEAVFYIFGFVGVLWYIAHLQQQSGSFGLLDLHPLCYMCCRIALHSLGFARATDYVLIFCGF
jgi:ACS family sodium-dependent inorganic phosphate cotransporter